MTSAVGAVQYLWKVYKELESNGGPNTLKLESHCAPPRITTWFVSTSRIALTMRLYKGSERIVVARREPAKMRYSAR